MEDPHPGRCKNLRPCADPTFGYRRCLGYEHKPHQCHFEEDTSLRPRVRAAGWMESYVKDKPKPWVDPTDPT